MKIRVPDYYGKFVCKCGECRHVCCNGWRVTLSQREYFSLLGLECSPELRRKLDCAFVRLDNGDENRFAEVKRTYEGKCIIQREDGLCGLQRECGEGVLPQICRLYPRNIVFCAMKEGAIANSCEKTVELLLADDKILGEEETESVDAVYIEVPEGCKALQDKAFNILKNRTIPLKQRFAVLGEEFGFEDNKENYGMDFAMSKVWDIIVSADKFSPSFRAYSGKVIKLLSDNSEKKDFAGIIEKYKALKSAFDNAFPKQDIWFEKIMCNHLFYERFPYSENGENLFEKYAENCIVYFIIKFISAFNFESDKTPDGFVDCICSLFRCIEHTNLQILIRNELLKAGVLNYSFIMKLSEI